MPDCKCSGKPVHRWSRIRMPAFIPIKLLVLLDRNNNDERTSMYRYFGVNLVSFCCIDVKFDWKECFYCWGVWHIHFEKGNSYLG